jgi:riboflavin kinase, archaea type
MENPNGCTPEGKNSLLLRGNVVSGMGSFSYWIEKLQEHYLRKTGMRFYPGTLNVRLDAPYSLPKQVIRLEASEYGGTVSVNIVPCFIRIPGHSGKAAFLLRTDANEEERGHHPKTIVEIATDVRLRDFFGLKDEDLVEIEIEA